MKLIDKMLLSVTLLFVVTQTAASDQVSLQYQSASVRTVLTSLARVKNFNLLMSDKVQGEISIELIDVKWQSALNAILKLKGLESEFFENIMLVAPSDEFIKQKVRNMEVKSQLDKLSNLKSSLLKIHFAKAKDIAKTLKNSGNTILTERGQVSADERTNTLIIKDTSEGIMAIEQAVKDLDVQIEQVLIEARIVTVRDNLNEQLGIRWGMSDASHSGNRTSGSLNATSDSSGAFTDSHFLDRLNVNLPVANPAGSVAIQIARLADNALLDLELSAIERESKGEIIATPRILASNQHLSRIEQGTEIPYLQAAAHGATSVAFKKAVLSLEVTPQVTLSGNIILDLSITQDARGDTVLTSTGPAVAIDTQQIKTKVSVKNGETIVLGGIYQQQMINAVTKVPLLGDIPYIGRLFRTDSSYNEKRELLVFVTPKIINEE